MSIVTDCTPTSYDLIYMYVCTYVCMYVCMYECRYVRMYVRIRVCRRKFELFECLVFEEES